MKQRFLRVALMLCCLCAYLPAALPATPALSETVVIEPVPEEGDDAPVSAEISPDTSTPNEDSPHGGEVAMGASGDTDDAALEEAAGQSSEETGDVPGEEAVFVPDEDEPASGEGPDDTFGEDVSLPYEELGETFDEDAPLPDEEPDDVGNEDTPEADEEADEAETDEALPLGDAALPVVTVEPEALELDVGQSIDAPRWSVVSGDAGPLVWVSAKTSLVSVANGVVRGRAKGSTELRLTDADGVVLARVPVRVSAAPSSVKLTGKVGALAVGESFTFAATLSKGSVSPLSWTSDVPDVASVDADGVVTALAPGRTVIRVRCFNGKHAECTLNVQPRPEGIVLSEPLPAILGTDAVRTPGAALEPAGAFGSVEMFSSNPAVIACSGGKLTAKAAGQATICFRSTFDADVELKYDIEVLPGPTGIALNASSISLGWSKESCETFDLVARCPGSMVDPGLRFESSKSSVASVDGSGHIVPLKKGSATITVTTYNGFKARCKVSVKGAPGKVTLNKTTLVCPADAAFTTTLKAKLPSGTASALNWDSSDKTVATVDADGTVHPAATGSTTIRVTTITVTTFNGRKAACEVEVRPLPTSIIIGPLPATMGTGQSVTPKITMFPENAYGGYTLTLSKPAEQKKMGMTLKKGVLKASSVGVCYLQAKSDYRGSVSSTRTIKVEDGPSALALSPKSVTLGFGESVALTASSVQGEHVDPAYVYTSSNANVATVDAQGVVTAGSRAGSAKITVTACNGKTAKCTVTMREPPASAKLDKAALTIGVGLEAKLAVKLPSGTASREIRWESSDLTVATVEGGVVRGVGAGSAQITAICCNGTVSTPCLVTVCPAPAEIHAPVALTILKGKTATPTIRFDEGSIGVYELTSSAPAVVSVDGVKLKGKSKGTATVFVRVLNGDVRPEASFTVTVK